MQPSHGVGSGAVNTNGTPLSILGDVVSDLREVDALSNDASFRLTSTSLRALIDQIDPWTFSNSVDGLSHLGLGKERYAGKYIVGACTLEGAAKLSPEAGIDLASIRLIELDQIWEDLSRRQSICGRLSLSKSFLRPCRDERLIYARQEAYQELMTNTHLRSELVKANQKFTRELESPLLAQQLDGWDLSKGYQRLLEFREAILALVSTFERLPEAQSPYLTMIREDVESIKHTSWYALLKHGIMRTPGGLKTPQAVAKGEHRKPFDPWNVNSDVARASLPLMAVSVSWVATVLTMMALSLRPGAPAGDGEMSFKDFATILGFFGVTMGLGLAGPVIFERIVKEKRREDQETVGAPLQKLIRSDDTLSRALDSVGRLGELIAGVQFIDKARVPLVYPQVRSTRHHFFKAKNLRSPLFWEDPSFVPSDIEIGRNSLIFLTGPNSGGKTTLGRTLLITQAFAQMGLPIAATEAEIGIADYIGYQAPQTNQQSDREGRFGTELARTRDLLFASGVRSFVNLDELAEGTTEEEKTLFSRAVLEAFVQKRTSLILTTHNIELAKLYERLGVGEFWQVEFRDGNPTHKIVPGISTSSHAARIAAHLGFSIDDIRAHLREQPHRT
ncbi:MAG: hypothetical protein K1X83_00565 [Oligoflexia bacterium]|nr:hypothetical protein [Oligoflexia bacterium]